MKLSLLSVCTLLVVACTSVPGLDKWQPQPVATAGERKVVPAYEVEVLPMMPTVPGTVIVGKFLIHDNASLDMGNEEFMNAIKKRAAAMGGNTIIYAGEGETEAQVAYVPLETVNYHGGDEALIEAGILSEEN